MCLCIFVLLFATLCNLSLWVHVHASVCVCIVPMLFRFYKVHFSVFLLISIDNRPISSRSCNMINIGIYENDY